MTEDRTATPRRVPARAVRPAWNRPFRTGRALRSAGALIGLLCGPAHYAATATVEGEVVRVLATGDGRFGGCMAALDVAPADAGLDCRSRWVSFGCTGGPADGATARRMFDALRAAVAAEKTVGMRVTDERKYGGFCRASRIMIQDGPYVDADGDGDGVPDLEDDVPDDASETVDSDDDGIGDNADPDDDNAGDPDEDETEAPAPVVLERANGHPRGIAHAGGLLYVVDWIDDKVYVYATSGRRRPDFDFDLEADTRWAQSITHADGLLYVGVYGDSGNHVDAYTTSGRRRESADFALRAQAPWWPSGITHVDGVFYVADQIADEVFAYTNAGERRPGADFELEGADARGITHAEGRLYVLDKDDGRVYAYSTSGRREPGLDFGLDPENGDAQGIAYADGSFYVVDELDDRIYVYPLARRPSGPDLAVQRSR